MKGALHRFSLEGRPCACFAPQEEGPLPLLVLCGWGMEEKLPSLSQELPPALLFFARAEGDRDFTPWPAPGVREGETFTGEAGAYLEFLTEAALPYLERGFGASPRPEGRGILGYSLGGLFALWAQAQSGAFQTAGSLSGSLRPGRGRRSTSPWGTGKSLAGRPCCALWGTAPAGPTPFIRKRAWTRCWNGTKAATARAWTPGGKRPWPGCAGPWTRKKEAGKRGETAVFL